MRGMLLVQASVFGGLGTIRTLTHDAVTEAHC